MVNTDITVKNNAPTVLDLMTGRIAVALEAIGLTAERYAKELCPVDTGRLRNSISHARDDSAAYIGTNVEYAAYVELGTSVQKAKPYLRPAAENHSDEYKEIVKTVLQGG